MRKNLLVEPSGTLFHDTHSKDITLGLSDFVHKSLVSKPGFICSFLFAIVDEYDPTLLKSRIDPLEAQIDRLRNIHV